MSTNNDDLKLELYRQAWEQSRHNEVLRGSYTAWAAAIAIGSLAFTAENPAGLHWLFLLLAALTFSAYMVSLRTWLTTRRWLVTQVRIQRESGLAKYVVRQPFLGGRGLANLLNIAYMSARFDLTHILLHIVSTIIFVAAHLMDFSVAKGVDVDDLTQSDRAVLAAILLVMVLLGLLFYFLIRPFDREIQQAQ